MTFQQEMIEAIPELQDAYAIFEWPHLTTVCVEALLPPLLVKLAVDRSAHIRLAQIMAWVEGCASGSDQEIRNIVAGCICAPLMSTYVDDLPKIMPYLGQTTRDICRAQFSLYNADERIRKLFDIV